MKAVLLTLLVFTGTAALANEAGDELANRTAFQSTLSRQSVQQEFLGARRDGILPITTDAASMGLTSVPVNEPARFETRREARQRVVHD